ncbi:MAG: aldose epimerase family protein [Elusimicrobiota bacterium]
MKPSISRSDFGRLPDGRLANLYLLDNGAGVTASITDYGGILVSLFVPDRSGAVEDVVLGLDSLDGYLADKASLGVIAGRYANRIARGRFELDGKTIVLPVNSGGHHLHGGRRGFGKALWKSSPAETEEGPALDLELFSPDGEEGYPGNLTVRARYTLTRANELRLDYEAATDRPTVINLTHHSYFNLGGAGSGDMLGHELTLFAGRFAAIDGALIPTGELRPVEGTPFDFRTPRGIGARINGPDEQLRRGLGYDHSWLVDAGGGERPVPAAAVREPRSGRVMEVLTTEPDIHLYTGNFLDGIRGKGGRLYGPRAGLCLETQHFPDSPNQPAFPSTVLRPEKPYRSTTIHRFSAG